MTDFRLSRRQFVALPTAAACLMLPSVRAFAQDYPSRPIKIVVPSPPGGTTDLIARLIGNQLQAAWKEPVLVENKPGAGLRLGADYVAKSAPDGYTLLLAAVHHSIAQAVYKKNSYDLQKDLTPVTIIANVPNVLIVSSSLPVTTVQEFIALAKADPGKLSYGSTGYGTAHHLIGEQFNDMAGTQLLHVPYKGSAPAITDLMGGQIHAMFDTASSCLPYITSGKVRALAVTPAKRSIALPDVPTLSESGLTGFDIGTWFGMMAPAGTPPAIIEKLQTEIARILTAPEASAQFSNAGAEPVGNTPEEMGRQIADEIQSFSELAKKINLELD